MELVAPRRGREGSRWYNTRPSGEEIATWFKDVPLHKGMLHEHYISGVTLIQATEKSDEVTGFDETGAPVIGERKDLVHVPYPKVETRVAYFWQLMNLHEDWVGEIVPVPVPGAEPIGMTPGFFRYSASKPDGKVVNFICCSMQVRVWERSRTSSDRRLIMGPPPGTKAVAATTRWDADANAVMKAETGAVGRALGMAGMLVVPGSGVASYEDMQEALYGPPAGSAEAEPRLPDSVVPAELVADDAALRARANTLVDELRARDAKGLDQFQEWARERNLSLANAQGSVLRGVIRKLEGMLEAAGA
jgi:hypothetical protein